MGKKVFWRRPERRASPDAMSDKDLARKLRERISGELPPSGTDRLRFYVREGAVTIYGSVAELDDRHFVRQLVQRTSGVVKVYDHLTIEP